MEQSDCLHVWSCKEGEDIHVGNDDVKDANGKTLKADQKEWNGVAMRISDVEVVVLISAQPLCCETWTVEIDKDFKSILNEKILCVQLNVKREKERKERKHHIQFLCVDIHTSAKVYTIDLTSEHNGCYPHDVHLIWPNHREITCM